MSISNFFWILHYCICTKLHLIDSLSIFFSFIPFSHFSILSHPTLFLFLLYCSSNFLYPYFSPISFPFSSCFSLFSLFIFSIITHQFFLFLSNFLSFSILFHYFLNLSFSLVLLSLLFYINFLYFSLFFSFISLIPLYLYISYLNIRTKKYSNWSNDTFNNFS